MTRGFVVALIALALAGCAHASWETYKRSPSYRIAPTIPVWIDISDQVAQADTSGYTATMVQTMEAELAARGVQAQIFTPSVGVVTERRHLPRVEIVVRSWNEGSSALRHLSPVGGEPKMIIEMVVLSVENQAIFAGRMASSQTDVGSDRSREVAETAEIAGKLLAITIAGR